MTATPITTIRREILDLLRAPLPEATRAAQAAGRPVVGYFCPYLPPELLLAAGAVPVRLRGVGGEDSVSADAYLSGRICTYVRHVVSRILDGPLADLDGILCLNTCDHVRRAADVIKAKTRIRYQGFLSVPRSLREDLYPFYREELERLIGELEQCFGVVIDAAALRRAMQTTNALRARLNAIEAHRRSAQPRIAGSDMLAAYLAAQVLPPETALPLLEGLEQALTHITPQPTARVRLVVIGGELDAPEYLEVLESQGADLVADQLCFGSRSLGAPLDDTAADPLEALARASFFKPSCARMIGDFPSRWNGLIRLVEEVQADGVVFVRMMFCDPWAADLHNVLHRSQRAGGPPVLSLTREYGLVPTGQLRTRAQAFVERLTIDRSRRRIAGGEGG